MPIKAPRGLVYVLTSPCGRQYVGQTAGPMYLRLSRHVRDTLRNSTRPICSAILEYGIDAFRVEIVAHGLSELADRQRIEAETITSRNSIFPNGLNILSHDGDVSRLHSREVIELATIGKRRFFANNPEAGEKMIAKARAAFDPEKARQTCLQRNADPEFQKRVAAANKIRDKNPEYRARIKALGQDRAKIKDSEYPAILSRIANGESKASIGRSYGATGQAINVAIKRNT